jgi:DNA-binding NarL/FixJ family response regulator
MRYDKTLTEPDAAKFMMSSVKTMTKLTTAEKRVIALVSHAKTNKEIAAALGISPATVKRHLENILRKLQLKNRVEAAIYAFRNLGCPRGSDLGCPLDVDHEKINLTREKWAV